MKVTASIVLYNTDLNDLLKSAASFLDSSIDNKKLFLVDNSPSDQLKTVISDKNVKYIYNPANTGFGDGHNIAIRQAIEWGSDYHFVINPDVSAKQDIISPMIDYMEIHTEIGMMMPKVLNLDGTVQNLPKLLPSPYAILMRKAKFPKQVYQKFINQYELRLVAEDKVYETPILSGCFTLFRVKALKEIGLYDDRFFMYFEDWDISRRMNQKYKTIYFPKVAIYHGYESGANRNLRLFKIFVESAIKYFNKWGWVMDSDRNKVNRKTLRQFK